MTDKRQTDKDVAHRWLRGGNRVFAVKGLWYFQTREGTVEGPYADRKSAERFLESYVQVMGSKFVPGMEFSLMEDAAPVARSADLPDLGLGRLARAR